MSFKRFFASVMAIAFVSLLAIPTASAGDCKSVKFKFTDSTGAKIKVKTIECKGNDGSWTENISNKQIETNKSYTTGSRRLNKLDSGKSGDFTVKYDRWDAPNNKWKAKSQKFSNKKCTDGKTFSFTLTVK